MMTSQGDLHAPNGVPVIFVDLQGRARVGVLAGALFHEACNSDELEHEARRFLESKVPPDRRHYDGRLPSSYYGNSAALALKARY